MSFSSSKKESGVGFLFLTDLAEGAVGFEEGGIFVLDGRNSSNPSSRNDVELVLAILVGVAVEEGLDEGKNSVSTSKKEDLLEDSFDFEIVGEIGALKSFSS